MNQLKTKKILIWGAQASLPAGESFDINFARSGENFGNILIGSGVASVLDNCEFILRDQLSSPEEADERCDHIVIPAANFLWKGFDFAYMADFIEATNLPVTILGLGAQTNDRSRVSEIHPNTLRLVKIISERSPSLGVRGYYTAEVLAAHGILNVEVLGCPSLYTNLKPPTEIKTLTVDDLGNLAVNFSRRVSSHSFSPPALRAIENALLKIAIRFNLDFVAQDELEELALAFDEFDKYPIEGVSNYFSNNNKEETLRYFSDNGNYFCNYADWARFISHKSGTVGSRLHGNIISLVNGLPGFVIAHDSRTLEICALAGIPYLNVNDIDPNSFDENDLVGFITSACYNTYQSNIKVLFKRYKKFLDNNLLENRIEA